MLYPSPHLIGILISSLNITCYIWPCWRVSLVGYVPACANYQSNYWRRIVLITTRYANKVACSWINNTETTLQAFFFSPWLSHYHFLWCRAVVQMHKNSGLILFWELFSYVLFSSFLYSFSARMSNGRVLNTEKSLLWLDLNHIDQPSVFNEDEVLQFNKQCRYEWPWYGMSIHHWVIDTTPRDTM